MSGSTRCPRFAASHRPGRSKKIAPNGVTIDGYGALPMKSDVMSRFRTSAKVCSLVIIVLLVIAALGPAKWAPRTELGWQFDHFIGYFGITLFFCFTWP